jgi:SnoaL-like polyketide cyclase
MLYADDARKVLQNLPMRIPKPVNTLNYLNDSYWRTMLKETTVWLHTVNGDPITGRTKREMRREIYQEEVERDDDMDLETVGLQDEPDATIPMPEITIEDPPSVGMPRTYLEGLSDIEFSLTSELSRRGVVAMRWELHGSHTGTLLGQPATGRTVTVTGLTILRFAENPDSSYENPGFTATEEWTCWDLAALLEQMREAP